MKNIKQKRITLISILITTTILITPIIIIENNNYKTNTLNTNYKQTKGNVSSKIKNNFNKWRNKDLENSWSNADPDNKLQSSGSDNILTTYESRDKKLWISVPLDNIKDNINSSDPKLNYKNNVPATLPSSLYCSNDGKGDDWAPVEPTLFGAGNSGNAKVGFRATIYSIFESNEGILFIGGVNLGKENDQSLFYLNAKGSWIGITSKPIQGNNNGDPVPIIKTIYQTQDNAMWFGGWFCRSYTESSSLYRTENGKVDNTSKFVEVTKFSTKSTTSIYNSQVFNGPSINTIKQTTDGTIWIGGFTMSNNSVQSLCYLQKGKSWDTITDWTDEQSDIFAKYDTAVNLIYQTNDKTIWALVSNTAPPFPIFHDYSQNIYCLKGGPGHIWKKVDTSKFGVKSDKNNKQQLNTLFQASDGSLWIGGTFLTSYGQKSLFYSKDGKGDDWVVVDRNGYSSVDGASVYSISQDKNGTLLIGRIKLGSDGKSVLFKETLGTTLTPAMMNIYIPMTELTPYNSPSHNNNNTGAIIGGLIGGVLVIGIIVGSYLYFSKKKKRLLKIKTAKSK